MNCNQKSGQYFLMRSAFTLTVALAGLSLTSCNQHSDKTSETSMVDSTTMVQKPLVDTAQLRADWEKFKVDAKERIKESDDSIAAFKKRVQKFDAKMKVKYERDVALLERKDDTLKMKLDNYKDEGKEKWEDFKMHFNHDMDAVKAWLKDSTATKK